MRVKMFYPTQNQRQGIGSIESLIQEGSTQVEDRCGESVCVFSSKE